MPEGDCCGLRQRVCLHVISLYVLCSNTGQGQRASLQEIDYLFAQNHLIVGKNSASCGQQKFKGSTLLREWGFWAARGFWAGYRGRQVDLFADSPNSAAIIAQEAPCAHREPQGADLAFESTITRPQPGDRRGS